MKQLYNSFFTALLLLLFAACSDSTSQENEIQTKTETIALGGNTFLTAGNSGTISQNGISDWTDPDALFSVFVKLSEPALTEVKLRANTANSSSISVEINGETRTEQITSEQNLVSFGEFELPGGEYIQIDLRGVEKAGTEYTEASELILELPLEINASYVKDNENGRYYWGRRGPSVHLSYETPDETDLKWFYSEVTVPEDEDPAGSFYMANGFGEGYFGIQVNSETERRVLFSVWSPYQTDNPEEIPEEKRIQLLDSGEGVNVGEFGNEGSGGQSFLRYDWTAETTYRFLNSVEPDGSGNSIYTAYFYSPDGQEWRLIARFLRPQTDTWYTRPHSFLESFLTRNGHLSREAFYHNQWAMDTSGNWHELTKAIFTGDDIAQSGYRLDFDGGLQGDLFFMRNGGFFVGDTSLGSEFTRPDSGVQPNVNMDDLP